MGNKLYVGNLSYGIKSADLERIFAEFGPVTSAQVITDRETKRSKGFGFVEMGSEQGAQAAIAALHGKSVEGRPLTVNEARPHEPRLAGHGAAGGAGNAGARRHGGVRGPYGMGRSGSSGNDRGDHH